MTQKKEDKKTEEQNSKHHQNKSTNPLSNADQLQLVVRRFFCQKYNYKWSSLILQLYLRSKFN
jgi:hypothetical protein